MNRRRNLFLAALLLIGAGSFAITWAARARQLPVTPSSAEIAQQVLLDWLNTSPEQQQAMREHDPSFAADLLKLRQRITECRMALAAAMENPELTDTGLREHANAVIAANADLERRVIEHLIIIRHHLTVTQQRQLFNLCSTGVRQEQGQGNQWRNGYRGGAGSGGRAHGPAWNRDRGTNTIPSGSAGTTQPATTHAP